MKLLFYLFIFLALFIVSLRVLLSVVNISIIPFYFIFIIAIYAKVSFLVDFNKHFLSFSYFLL